MVFIRNVLIPVMVINHPSAFCKAKAVGASVYFSPLFINGIFYDARRANVCYYNFAYVVHISLRYYSVSCSVHINNCYFTYIIYVKESQHNSV